MACSHVVQILSKGSVSMQSNTAVAENFTNISTKKWKADPFTIAGILRKIGGGAWGGWQSNTVSSAQHLHRALCFLPSESI
jgi:hypothetical protein